MESGSSFLSLKGVFVSIGGAALYWLSRNSGRDAATLKSVRRVSQLSELAAILENARNAIPVVVAVAGRVGSETPVTCAHSSLRGVILEETQEQSFLKHNDSGSWVQESAQMVTTSKEVPWYLDDGTGQVMVVGARAAAGLELTAASEVFQKLAPSTVRSAMEYLQGLKMLGVKKVERILPIGTALTVVGEAVRDDQGRMRVQKPYRGPFYASPQSLDQLISMLGKWSRLYQWLSVGCTLMGVWLLASHSLRHLAERRRRRALRRRVLEAAAAADKTEHPEGEGGEGSQSEAAAGEKAEGGLPDLCVICLEQKYTAVFVPCGHMCCCTLCSAQLNNCPLCRRRIDQVVRAYRH